MFKWLIKRKTNELIKLVLQNDMALSQIIDMQQLDGAKPLHKDFAKWVQNRFVINHAALLRFKKSGSIKDREIVKSLLDLNMDLRRWYDESMENLKFYNFPVKSFDDTYKPLIGWDRTYKDFFNE
jgi:hypothetical protein